MISTVLVSSKGQLVIPREIRDQLGIVPGTKIAMTVRDGRLILQPSTMKLIEELCGITAGGPSLSDDLIASRREDRRRSDERIERMTGEKVSA